MRIHTLSATFLAPVLLAACAATKEEAKVESSVVLGPGGRVEGRLVCPAGAETEISLDNKGPGRADYVIRTSAGEKLASGVLREASAGIEPAETTTLVVVVEAYDDAGTTVEYEVESAAKIDVTWDQSRAHRAEGAK